MFARPTVTDRLLAAIDEGLRACFAEPEASVASPAEGTAEPELDAAERDESIALMRVNHAGEIAAQALYAGQAVLARSPETIRRLERAAQEEHDHLAWCAERLGELGGRPSLLTPVWYAGSAAIGMTAALAGDRVSLGFVNETETQVEAHLHDHLARLPEKDSKSRRILEQMSTDESRHARQAIEAGGQPLPAIVRRLMHVGGEVLRRFARVV